MVSLLFEVQKFCLSTVSYGNCLIGRLSQIMKHYYCGSSIQVLRSHLKSYLHLVLVQTNDLAQFIFVSCYIVQGSHSLHNYFLNTFQEVVFVLQQDALH